MIDNKFEIDKASDVYTTTLSDFIFNRVINLPNDTLLSDANNIALFALAAIQKNNKNDFEKIYSIIGKRKPSDDSDWIHNDILIFSITLGVKKFKLNSEWLLNVLEKRKTRIISENSRITQTFIDVTNNNYENRENLQPLMVVYCHFLDIPFSNEEYINSTFSSFLFNTSSYGKSAFIDVINKGAIFFLFSSKGLLDPYTEKQKEVFIGRFKEKVRLLAFLYWLLILALSLALTIWLFTLYPERESFFVWLFVLLPITSLSFSFFYVVKNKGKICLWIERMFYKYYSFIKEK